MIKGLTEVMSNEALLGFLAASGGIVRGLVVGIADSKTLIREAGIVLFCSIPVGVLLGLHIKTVADNNGVLPMAASFAGGVLSLKIVRLLLTVQLEDIIKIWRSR